MSIEETNSGLGNPTVKTDIMFAFSADGVRNYVHGGRTKRNPY